LLRNTAYKSEWLVTPDLVESKATTITGANKEQRRLFDFTMRISVKRPQDQAAVSADAPASAAPAAATPASAAAKKA
jgi:type IV pilus assembly protein PilN